MSYRGTSWVNPSGWIVQVAARWPGEAEVGVEDIPIGVVRRMGGNGRPWCARRDDGTWIEDEGYAGAARAFTSRAEAADALAEDWERRS